MVSPVSQHEDLSFFFFNDTATTEISTLALHDALPILASRARSRQVMRCSGSGQPVELRKVLPVRPISRALSFIASDRKSTRLNSSHANISYAAFCLKKKQSKYRYDRYTTPS